jgi:glycerophosphoryl diester phosphodiesterase
MTLSPDLSRFDRPLLIGHRGYPAKHPENTLASFQAAMDAGCDMIELDVTLTKDRRVVVIHDDTLHRTTTGHGHVKDFTLEEIKRLDAGSWFDPRFSAERIPLLAEVFDLVGGRCLLNIEIKARAFEKNYPTDAIERQVVDMVKRRQARRRVLIGSFEEKIVARIAAVPDPPAVCLISQYALHARTLRFLKKIKAFSWNPLFKVLSPEQVETVHAAGLRVFPWTINTPDEAARTLRLGVDGLICNDPQLAKEALREAAQAARS